MPNSPDAVTITWCGHAAFRVCQGPHAFYIDPFLKDNPRCPDAEKQPQAVEAVFVTHAHAHHAGDTLAIARQQPAQIVAVVETAAWLQRQGAPAGQLVAANEGGTAEAAGVKAHLVHAAHSGGIFEAGQPVYCGKPVGYVFEFPNGPRIYHAGDTGLFGDMELIADLYHPDVALLPIGGIATMGPREAAHACRLLRVATVVPMHYGTFGWLTGTPEELRRHVNGGCQVVELVPGVAWKAGDGPRP
jgi:L-ascorbate metabolism protein UlaG (beta-lactamase superfamily)